MPINTPPLSEVWPLLNRLDWTNLDFSREKAYVCAIFSELAYWHLPSFEVADRSRIKVVPCFGFQALVREGVGATEESRLIELAQKSDFTPPFIVARRYAVVVVWRTPHVVFVAVRGTKCLYDWLINLNAIRLRANPDSPAMLFHRGFFRAISACLPALGQELRQYFADNVPVYVTGHSLGGAMAAIMHAVWQVTLQQEYVQGGGIMSRSASTHAAFTFGMPRYGNFFTMASYRNPYHVYHIDDLVPTVPPRWLGYEDSTAEYRTDGLALEQEPGRHPFAFSRWLLYLVSGLGIRAHFMENYRRALVP